MIRLGQVWDDARTILLVIVLMFFMLSTSLDFHLAVYTLDEPWPGTLLLAGGVRVLVLLTESAPARLRIGLPPFTGCRITWCWCCCLPILCFWVG